MSCARTRRSVGPLRWTWQSTCSTACWSWDARTTSAWPNPGRVGVIAPASLIHATQPRRLLNSSSPQRGHSSRILEVVFSVPEKHVSCNPRAKQGCSRIEEISHPVELVRHGRTTVRRPMHTVHIPLQGSQAGRSLAGQFGKQEVLKQDAGPSGIHYRRDRPDPPPLKVGGQTAAALCLGKQACEAFSFHGADRHALALYHVPATRTCRR